uniref:HPt domain-containing protein n=1 Tax=Octactis speculum TaxID=3111310 RepID=A0A7S2DUJ5_9STRA|mmetsp:Transcript_54282/g.74166  ORF Transcript_54282/g.74166 Transcript_54282/m.74166 type:complete len:178 (+) Transcript_54282:231-764(+)
MASQEILLVPINWDEAKGQCDGDTEFLNELLNDFMVELLTAGEMLDRKIKSKEGNWKTVASQQAHAIKGAAANLMCHELRSVSETLEKLCKSLQSKEGMLISFLWLYLNHHVITFASTESEEERARICSLNEEFKTAMKKFKAELDKESTPIDEDVVERFDQFFENQSEEKAGETDE